MKTKKYRGEGCKSFEEQATKRFKNYSATQTWPEGTTVDDFESPQEVRARLKKEGRKNMNQKVTGEDIEKALGLKSGEKMDSCLKCGKRKVAASTFKKVKAGQWEDSNLHMFCEKCLGI